MCSLWLTGEAARDKTVIISVKIEFLFMIYCALLHFGGAGENFTPLSKIWKKIQNVALLKTIKGKSEAKDFFYLSL